MANVNFDDQIAKQLIIYDENGNPSVEIGPGAYIKVTNPNDSTQYLEIALDEPSGIPYLRIIEGTVRKHDLGLDNAGNPSYRLQDVVSGPFIDSDVNDTFALLEVFDDTISDSIQISAGISDKLNITSNVNPIDLQYKGGQLTYTGVPVPRRMGRTNRTVNSGTFTTTETMLDALTVPLVSGREYRVEYQVHFNSTVSNDRVGARIREDNVSGTGLAFGGIVLARSGRTECLTFHGYYTAVSTGNKTFVGTGERTDGSGNINAISSGTTFAYLTVHEEA